MAWGLPDDPVADAVITAEWGQKTRACLDVLSTHAHTGAAGQGAELAHAALTGVTSDLHHAQAHHAEHEPAGGDAMAVNAAAGTGSLRELGTGATDAAAGNHTHAFAEVQQDTDVKHATPDDGAVLSIAGAWEDCLVEAGMTVEGSGNHGVVIAATCRFANNTGNSDGHKIQMRIKWEGAVKATYAQSAQIDDGKNLTQALIVVVPSVAAGAKTATVEAEKVGGTGPIQVSGVGLTVTEIIYA